MTDILDQPATIGDVVSLLALVSIETMRHATLTSAAADNTLIDMANDFLTMSEQSPDQRTRQMLGAFAKHLVATEPGA